MKSTAEALIALGANLPSSLGGPKETLEASLALLEACGAQVKRRSDWWRTPAFPSGSGPDFVNGAAALCWEGDAQALLRLLHKVELELGRQRIDRWEARCVDLDLLALGETIAPNEAQARAWISLSAEAQQASTPPELILPHPRLHERVFVLAPLAQIAPNWRHPILDQTVAELFAATPLAERQAASIWP